MVRLDAIQRLTTAAHAGMKSVAQDTSVDEVFSAYMSMARCAVMSSIEMGRDNEDMRGALMGMLLLLEEEEKCPRH